MTFEQIIALVGIIVAALAGIGAFMSGLLPQIYNDWFGKSQEYKFFYMKVNCLKQKKPHAKPFYKRYVKRLDKHIDVFSEVQCYRLNIFSSKQKIFHFKDRSSGVVDVQIFHPFQEELIFTDEKSKIKEGSVDQTVRKKSKVYFTRALYLNGFQPGNEEMSLKLEKDTIEATLIVDFSSLPHIENLMERHPVGYHVTDRGVGVIGVKNIHPGIFSLTATENLKQDDVLKIDFFINWNSL